VTLELDQRHRRIVAEILTKALGQTTQVKVYGSRATGKARPASDLDLVIFPPASESLVGELALAFEECDLPIFVDVVAWQHISNPVLRAEIERDAIPFE
jgi:uncharacterized protein